MYGKALALALSGILSLSSTLLTACENEEVEHQEEVQVQQEETVDEDLNDEYAQNASYKEEQEEARLLLKDYAPLDQGNVEITKSDEANVVIMKVTFTRTDIDNTSNEDKKYLIEQMKIFREKMLDIYEMNNISTDISILLTSNDNYCVYILNSKHEMNIHFYED